jgi:ABC-2 type transport system permease protein
MSRSLHNIRAIAGRELYSYFASPVAYVFIIIFLLLAGFFTFQFGAFFERDQAALGDPFFTWHPWLFLVLVPAAGMRIWAEERRSGTLELLFTLPTTPWQAIIGKYLAGGVFVAVALAGTFPMVITVYKLGNPDAGVIVTGYLGSYLVALSFLAISGLTSSMTRNQVVSFIVSVCICLVLVLVGHGRVTAAISLWLPVPVVDLIASFSVLPHYESLQRGVIDLRDIAYCMSLIVFSLFSTSIVLNTHRS